MKHSMHNPSVWHNINRLHDHLADPHFKGNKISIMIDCSSGEFNIPRTIGELESKIQLPKEPLPQLKHAELTISVGDKGTISFEWVDTDKEIHLTEKAALILRSTLDEMNRCGGETKSGSPHEALSQCMSSMKRELSSEIAEQSAWRGDLKRMAAEKLLLKSSSGTYLLRNGDECTSEIEENLAKHDPFPVRCFVMTVVGKSENIYDRVLIQRPNGWAIYNDDLELSDYFFKNLSEIISQAGGKTPLESGRAA